MNIPDTFAGFLFLLVSDVLFLGGVAAAVTGVIINSLVPTLSENGRRVLSIAVPIGLVTIGLVAQVGLNYTTLTPDTIYQAYVTALGAIVGKQVIYIGYKSFVAGGRTRPVTPEE